MNDGKNVKKVVTNFIWRFLERAGAQIVQFIVSIILARLLDPSEYGTVALVVVIANVLQVFVDSGFGNALIQKKEVDELDYSSVFVTNLFMCLSMYALTFFAAPYIGIFFENEKIVPVIRVLCITIVISGFKNVQQAYISRNLLFKKFFIATIVGTIISAFLGVLCAYRGMGIWALVIQRLSNLAIDTFILWLIVKWRPKLAFSLSRVKALFGFGYKLMLSSLIDTVYNNIRQFLIGKIYSEDQLAYYNQGNQYPAVLAITVNTSIDGVLFPVLSQSQDNKEALKGMLRRSIQISTFFLAPIMLGLAAVSDNLISVLLTDKWILASPFLKIFCLAYLFYPINTANLSAINAQGRSDIFLKLEIIKKIVGTFIIVISIQYGVFAIAIGELISSLICQVINAFPNRKLLDYSYLEQIKDIFPNLFNAIIMFIVTSFFSNCTETGVLNLLIQIFIGIIVYLCIIVLTKNESLRYILDKIRVIKA